MKKRSDAVRFWVTIAVAVIAVGIFNWWFAWEVLGWLITR